MTRLLAGQIGKPHGLGGEVYVVRISDDPHRFDPGASLWHEDGRELVVASARPHRQRFLVRFEGCSSREEAEALRGRLYVDADEARSLEDDEYWHRDLVGLEARFPNGAPAGVVTALIDGPAQDLLVLDTPQGERMVPFVRAMVPEVDLESRRLTIDPPEGLLD